MHSHDLDQIAALADGSLAPHLEPEARALIASCEECREEHEAQTQIISLLADTEPARLSDLERVRLHQTIANLEPATVQPSWFTWMPRLAVAAAAVAFVGTFGVLFFGGGNDQSTPDIAAAEAPAVTQAPVEEESLAADGVEALSQAAPSDETAADEGAFDTSGRDADTTSFAEIGELPVELSDVTEGYLWRYLINADTLDISNRAGLECLGAVEELGPLKLAATARQDGDPLEIYLADGEVIVLDPDDCSEVATP